MDQTSKPKDEPQPAARSFHDHRDVTGDPSVKTDRFTPRPAYLDPVPYWSGR